MLPKLVELFKLPHPLMCEHETYQKTSNMLVRCSLRWHKHVHTPCEWRKRWHPQFPWAKTPKCDPKRHQKTNKLSPRSFGINYMFFLSLWIFRESSGFTVAICRWYGSWAFTTLTSPKRMTIGRARHAAEADRGFSDGAAGAWYHAQEMRSVCNMMQHCIHENFLKHGWPTIRNLYVLYVSVNVDKMISKYQFHRSIVDMMWWDI